MPKDDLIDLLPTPKSPQTGSKSDPKYDSIESLSLPPRGSFSAFFVGLAACFVPTGIAVFTLKDRPGGLPVASVVGYTLIIPYILSNRYLGYVPWDLLTRYWKKFLPVHCLALAVVYGITAWAFAAKPRLPDWFITSGRKPALFYYCLGGILLVLAFWESSWISRHKSGSDGEQG